MKKIITSLLFISVISVAAYGAIMNVYVKDENGDLLPGAKVMLITHTLDPDTGWWQPDIDKTTLGSGLTDGNGFWTGTVTVEYLSLRNEYRGYQLLVIKQGYSPTIQQQMNDWRYGEQWVWINPEDESTITKNITLTSGLTDVGTVTVNFSYDKTDRLFFGQIHYPDTWDIVTDEIFYIDEPAPFTDTDVQLVFSNIPFTTEANVYRVNIHCPYDEIGMDRFVKNMTSPVSINLTQGGMAPPTTVNTDQSGNVVFEGVLKDTATVAIPDVRVMLFNEDNWQNPPSQTMTDANGYYAFYDTIDLDEDKYRIEFQPRGFMGKEIRKDVDDKPLLYTSGAYFNIGVTSLTYVYGIVSGTVMLDGVLLPQAHVNLWGDWADWDGMDDDNYFSRGSGNTNTDDGTFEITGLAPGNYRLEVYSDFTQEPYVYNNGADRKEDIIEQNGPWKHTGDDLRINIDTTTVAGKWRTRVFDANGEELTSSKYPLVIDIPGNKNVGGTISGTITYQENFASSQVDLGGSGNIFVIIARQDWMTYDPPQGAEWYPPAGGFTTIEGSGTEFTYSINVPLGYLYELEVRTINYGILRSGGWQMRADLRNSVTAVSGMDFDITPGGTIKGTVYLPDGTAFKPIQAEEEFSRNCNVHVRGVNVESWNWADVKDDGSFEVNGLVPGKYILEVQGWGGQFKWAFPPMGGVVVKDGGMGQTVYTEVNPRLKPGVLCFPRVTGDMGDGIEQTEDYLQGLSVIGVPSGTKMNHETMQDIFSDAPMVIFGRNPLGYWDPQYIAYGTYDFYAITGWHISAEFRGVIKDVEINETMAKEIIPDDHHWTGMRGQEVGIIEIDTAVGETRVDGGMNGQNIFRQSDLSKIAKNLDLIYEYLPSVVIFDTDGKIAGWALVTPGPEIRALWNEAIIAGDLNELKRLIMDQPPGYGLMHIREGTYTFIAAAYNYPPFVKQIEISGEHIMQFVDFDVDVGPGGSISGLVKDAVTNDLLSNAMVILTSKVKNRSLRTDSSGTFEFVGLPKGRYVIQVSKDGYALTGTRIGVEKDASRQINFKLQKAPGSFSGTVYWQMMPSPRVYPGAKVTAYDDTFNGLYPGEFLPKHSVTTDSDGKYTISGVMNGHTYKIFLIVDGKQLEFLEKIGTDTEVTGCDFVLRSEAPKLDVKSKISSDGTYITFNFESPKPLKTLPTATYHEGSVFDESLPNPTWVDITEPVDNQYKAVIAPSKTALDYVMRIIANDGINDTESIDVVFNLSMEATMKKELKSEYAEGGDVYMQESSDDLTALSIPTGGLTATESSSSGPAVGGFISTLPGVQISESNRNASTILMNVIESVLKSDLYTIDLTDAQINRDLTISLNYDKTNVTDMDSLKIYQFNSTTGKWDVLQGETMVDPVTGTISVDVDSIANASGMASPRLAGKSKFNGIKHVINPNAATSQTGTFAVFSAPPSNVKAYTGTEFKAYNFPNPFNLENKTLALTDDITTGATMTTRGTIIKYYMPSLVSGKTMIYLYNLAGEMVREIDEGDKEGGYIYYTPWDGRNDNGSSVASGVYFCMVQVNGKKQKLFKVAVIK